jgi:GNAT superfamily N-acetyltransferase
MTAISQSINQSYPQLRPLNVIRDLSSVADLVEICFSDTLDMDGHRFVQQMRSAAKDSKFLKWAVHAVDTSSLPLSGYVWEESGAIVGNISLIPFRKKGRKITLIANVAVHPDFRCRRIATHLTEIAIAHANQRNASEIWLQVREDNKRAVNLYQSFGFKEIARRTRWQADPVQDLPGSINNMVIRDRKADEWLTHKKWLERIYPEEISWYQPMEWYRFRPGLLPSIMRIFSDSESHHWTIKKDDKLLAIGTWFSELRRTERVFAAFPESVEQDGLTNLLLYIRRILAGRRSLVLDLPGGIATESIRNAGFREVRTLIWMRLDTTSNAIPRK